MVIQKLVTPTTTVRIRPMEYLKDIVNTRMLQIKTHWANMHIPEDTISNI